MFDDDGDGRNDRTVYQICTDYQSGFEGGNEYIKFLYFDLDNNKIYMNSIHLAWTILIIMIQNFIH